jgi:hypothetical protein
MNSGCGAVSSSGKNPESRTEFKPRVLEINPQEFPVNAFRFDIEGPNGTLVSVREANHERSSSDFHREDGKVLPGRRSRLVRPAHFVGAESGPNWCSTRSPRIMADS